MRKILFILFLLINLSFAFDLNKFEDRQSVLQDVKTMILYEESIAKAYEEHILKNYSIPNDTNISSLIGTLTLKNDISATIHVSTLNTKISYNLKSEIKTTDEGIKTLYESNTYRKRTYFRDGEIYFLFEDEFAKHLYDLIKVHGALPTTCSVSSNCLKNNHIYIGIESLESGIPKTYLIAYQVDNFKNGPIIITNDTSKHITESAFDSIPKGALLYDVDGVKYVKTLDGIEILK
ncbi:MAG: hypothetical protein AB7U51_09735 [Arcobacter sp.]|uniref:hypothetical protein n=1 Tax=Arcobacter sp. TaxID=1872629 RepID=UPI003D070702